MKRILIVITLALVSLGISAQEGLKGTWFAGGEFSYADHGSKSSSTTILPIAGTFVSPSVAVGAGIGYMGNKVDGVNTDLFVFKPLVRKYWNITGPVYLFGQAAAPMIFGDGVTNLALEVSPGIDLVVTSWMTIETSFSIFAFSYADVDGADTKWSIGMNPYNSISDRTVGELRVGVKFLF